MDKICLFLHIAIIVLIILLIFIIVKRRPFYISPHAYIANDNPLLRGEQRDRGHPIAKSASAAQNYRGGIAADSILM